MHQNCNYSELKIKSGADYLAQFYLGSLELNSGLTQNSLFNLSEILFTHFFFLSGKKCLCISMLSLNT